VEFEAESYLFLESAGKKTIPLVRTGDVDEVESSVVCNVRMVSEAFMKVNYVKKYLVNAKNTSVPDSTESAESHKVSSAITGQDFLASRQTVKFQKGVKSANCKITIIDDQDSPKIEGRKIFLAEILDAHNSEPGLIKNSLITISDEEEDQAVLQFQTNEMKVLENSNRQIQIPVVRSGDVTQQITAVCYTRQDTAMAREDFVERRRAISSRVVFLPHESSKNCTINLIDDTIREKSEKFEVHLDILYR